MGLNVNSLCVFKKSKEHGDNYGEYNNFYSTGN